MGEKLQAMRLRKRTDAEGRNAARAERSTEDQIARLDAKLGVGVGAVRERERLAAPNKGNASPDEEK